MAALPGARLQQIVNRTPREHYRGSLEPELIVEAPYPVGTVLKVGDLGAVTVTRRALALTHAPGFVPKLEMVLTLRKATAGQLRTTHRSLFVPLTQVQPTLATPVGLTRSSGASSLAR